MLNNLWSYFHYPELFKQPHRHVKTNDYHLNLAMEWLSHAAIASPSGGIPNSFNLITRRWGQAYRETTGYLIPTILAYGQIAGVKHWKKLAYQLADWEIANQDSSGGIGEPQKDGSISLKVFNTGQVILGWCAAYDHSQNGSYLEAAKRAGDWLLAVQNLSDGTWDRFANHGPNGIDTRVAWSLIELSQRTENGSYRQAAEQFLSWALLQQQPNGWFANSSLRDPERPWTHAIAYVISGFRQAGQGLGRDDYQKAAIRAAEKLLEYYQRLPSQSFLPASFDATWQSSDNYSCLTGNAQMAIEWWNLGHQTGRTEFLEGAERIIRQLKQLQLTTSFDPNVRGGLPGSHPVHGGYLSGAIPNWGVKFFADALILIGHTKHKFPLLG
jgi:uncharacterized protein YyaL (SSP411 family)